MLLAGLDAALAPGTAIEGKYRVEGGVVAAPGGALERRDHAARQHRPFRVTYTTSTWDP
jgi:hypothetical protein